MNYKSGESKNNGLKNAEKLELKYVNEYLEKITNETDEKRIYTRLLGVVDRVLKPAIAGVFNVNESYEFEITALSDETYLEDVKKEFDLQVEEEIIPWILNVCKPSIVYPANKNFLKQRIKSVLIYPVSSKGRVFGLLMAFNKVSEDELKDKSMDTMETVIKITGLHIGALRADNIAARSEEELKTYKDYVENIHNNLIDTFIIADKDFNIKEINKAGLHILGFEKNELVGRNIKDLFPEDREEDVIRFFQKLLKQRAIKNYELEIETKNKERIPVSVSCSTIFANDGSKIGFIVLIKDMSEIRGLIQSLETAKNDLLKQKENLEITVAERTSALSERLTEIQELTQYLNGIIQSMSNGLVAVDENFNVTMFNDAAEKLFGFESYEIVGRNLSLFPEMSNLYSVLKKTISEGKPIISEEVTVKNRKKENVPIAASTAVISDLEGGRKGAVCVFSDLSAWKEIQGRLMQSERMAALGEMAYAIAHEFRNPLNVVRGLSEILYEKFPDKKEKEYIDTIIAQIDRLEILIRKISDFVEVREPVYDDNLIKPFFEKVIKNFDVKFLEDKKKDVKFDLVFDTDIEKFKFDRKLIEQLMFLLLENAYDASEDGNTVKIKLFSNENNLCISVEDEGVGIREEDKEKVFEPFFTTKRPEKTGLGLSICKNIVDKHKGKIILNSEFGSGTEVIVCLPAE